MGLTISNQPLRTGVSFVIAFSAYRVAEKIVGVKHQDISKCSWKVQLKSFAIAATGHSFFCWASKDTCAEGLVKITAPFLLTRLAVNKQPNCFKHVASTTMFIGFCVVSINGLLGPAPKKENLDKYKEDLEEEYDRNGTCLPNVILQKTFSHLDSMTPRLKAGRLDEGMNAAFKAQAYH